MGRILGLDLGTNSIGWCLIEEDESNRPVEIVAGGVRIFQEAVKADTRTPKNHARRNARMARRIIQRRRRRKLRLRNYLVCLGWVEEQLRDMPEPSAWFNQVGDVYKLRAKGLDEPLAEPEFARVLMHLCARRGFLSNRKTTLMDLYRSGDPDVLDLLGGDSDPDADISEDLDEETRAEETAFKKEIAELRSDITASGARTLGEYLAGLSLHERKRGKRTERAMYEQEFDALWGAQQALQPDVYTTSARLAIHEIIFFQRPLKLKKNRRGRCSLEPSRFRAAKATLEAQEFRLLQDVNNLRYVDRSTGELLCLDDEQRSLLFEALQNQSTMGWSKVKKLLGLNSRVKLNLQESKPHLTGNRTRARIRDIDTDFWTKLEKGGSYDRFVEDLLTIKDRYALYGRIVRFWQVPAARALKYAILELEPGFANLSLKAIRILLPHLREGKIFAEARIAAGYGYETEVATLQDRLGEPPEARNPVVQKALFELRKLINAVLKGHGRLAAIRLEMARELKLTARQKKAADKQKKANEKLNNKARDQYGIVREGNSHLELREYPSRDDLLRYRLWEEAGGICVYTGQGIDMTDLWTAAIEVDHILPYSRSLDDSYMNKVVCVAEANREKGRRLPSEAWAGERLNDIIQRARKLPRAKQARLERRELDSIDDFISRQLNDTRYISRLAKDYLLQICGDISVSTGATTAFLRRQWGLNNILSDSGEKTRADHRHHFIDAVVVALVNRGVYRKLATAASRADTDIDSARLERLVIKEPIRNLRSKVEKLAEDMIVSHAINRKILGAFHEDTFRGATRDGEITRRVLVNGDLKASDIKEIIDVSLRRQLQRHLDRHAGKPKEAFAEPFSLGQGRYLRHVKIRSAKAPKPGTYLELTDVNGRIQRRANFGEIHHVEIFRDVKGKPKARFVTAFEAARRVKPPRHIDRVPIVDRSVANGEEFLFALHKNDSVSIEIDGKGDVYRVQELDRGGNRIRLRHHKAATLKNEDETVRRSVTKLVDEFSMRLLTVDVLGQSRTG